MNQSSASTSVNLDASDQDCTKYQHVCYCLPSSIALNNHSSSSLPLSMNSNQIKWNIFTPVDNNVPAFLSPSRSNDIDNIVAHTRTHRPSWHKRHLYTWQPRPRANNRRLLWTVAYLEPSISSHCELTSLRYHHHRLSVLQNYLNTKPATNRVMRFLH